MKLIMPFRLVLLCALSVTLNFWDNACGQATGYDDDAQLDFVWTPPDGTFDHYNAYVSVDGGEYRLDGTASTEKYTIAGQNGHRYTLKVSAVTIDGIEGPSSPDSDPVICDTLAPLSPVISKTYDVLDQHTVVLTLESGPSDANFGNYQVLGGQFAVWTDTSATKTFVFAVDPATQNVLQIREKDLAGNVGPASSLTVQNLNGDNDLDGIPNYWEYMYRQILNAEDPSDANIDSDGDGYTNLQEFLAGTDPTQAGSAPPDTTPPSSWGHSPGAGSSGVPVNANISFHVGDSGDGVDASSIVVSVNGSRVAPTITGTPADYSVTYDPPSDFGYSQKVTVTIDARDLHSPPNAMNTDRYDFTTAPPPEQDPAAYDPNVFFFENFEDGNLSFPKWDGTGNPEELATNEVAIVQGSIPSSLGLKVLQLTAARDSVEGLVKHFSPVETAYCRWYVRFGLGFDQRNLLGLVSLAADSTGQLYKAADTYPKGYDFFRSSLDFTTYWDRITPPGQSILNTYYYDMKPAFYDADGDGSAELCWPANVFASTSSAYIQDDRWHCIEMMIRANTPGLNDGEQAFWVDGRLVGYWSGLTWRLTDILKLNCLWLHAIVSKLSPSNWLWIDNIALSTRYVGPMDAPGDTTAVVMDMPNVRANAHTSAELAWTTDKPATSIVIYAAQGGDSAVSADTRVVTDHRVTLKGLKSGTEYRCRIISRDATAGNEAVSGELVLTTPTSSKGIFTEEWGDAGGSNHPGTVQDTYISVPGFSPDAPKESPAGPSESPTLYAYTFPAAKPATALLMKWEVSDIPVTAEVLDAKLFLYMFDAGGDPEYSLSVHRVVGVDPVVSEATGYYYKNGCPWDPFSGLYNDAPLAQSNIAPADDSVNVGNAVNEYKQWTITEMVSHWVAFPQENYGLIINPDPTASSGSYRYFRSSSCSDLSQRPRLVVTCRVSRGQNLYWQDGAFIMQTEPSFAEQYAVQSAETPGGPWKNETATLTTPWWHSGDLGEIRKKFFRVQTGF